MTQKEFTERTKVEVSAEEFEVINTMYMGSSLDKDAWCKQWCKLNDLRVANAKAEMKAKAKAEALRDKVFDILDTLRCYAAKSWQNWSDLTSNHITMKQVELLESIGIKVVVDIDGWVHSASISTTVQEVEKWLKAA